MALDPKDRGLALGNSDAIRTAHNSFAHPEPFFFSGKKKAKEGDAIYHFVAYVPFKGHVYELDGL
jgi:ubiquitin carboxyl-terminal hydrolase L5